MKRYKYIAVMLSVSMMLTACGGNTSVETAADNINDTDVISESTDGETVTETADTSELFSKRDLSGDYDTAACEQIALSDAGSTSTSSGVTIDQNTITITKEGDYLIEGSLSDGMIIVDVDKTEKVQLILNGVNMNSATSAPIYVRQADKVFVTLADGTTNTLANGGTFTAIDDNNIDAVIFSKDDLTLNGTGSLNINSPAGHGVVSKNDLVITNGTYEITAASHGLLGKDSVAIADGSFTITAGKDAIHSEDDEDDTTGKVFIVDGDFSFSAESDGISALNEVNIMGGKIVIEKSYEGLEARCINISGGEIDLTSSDDGLNATDKRSTATSQTTQNQAPEMPADQDKSAKPAKKQEEIATQQGEPASDTAQDQMDWKVNRGFGGGGGKGDTQSEANINILGGIVKINAEGDGIDSNGSLTVSGGEIYVAGPSNSGNAALDYGINATISGGIVVAAGQSGMAQNFGSDSTQGSILVNTQEKNEAGSGITLLDSDGKELLAWTAEKSYNSVVVSCPEIVDGGKYTLKTGETSTEITMDGLIYGSGSSMGGGMHGGGGRPDGQRPEFQDGAKPEDMPEMPDGAKPEDMPEPPQIPDGEQPEGLKELPQMPEGEPTEEL